MLEAVARGEAAITPAIAARILAELARPRGPRRRRRAPGSKDPDRLTERELDVLQAGGRRAAEQGDRRRARDLREHGQVPPAQHPGQAPRAEPRRGGRHGGPRGARRRTPDGRLPGPGGPANLARPARAIRPRRPTRTDRCRAHPIGRGPARAVPRCSFTRQGGGEWAIASTSTSEAASPAACAWTCAPSRRST